jgi:pantoate--beta-alanine ligase
MYMLVFKHIVDYKAWHAQQTGTIGFVPTMGALHQGHISLLETAKKQADTTVCSIFVNPTQFNNADDFAKYPIQLADDYRLLIEANVDVLFLPDTAEMYPEGLSQTKIYPIGYLDTILDGAMRPGHFQGVCRIVHKLLKIIEPQVVVMGQKDFQQCLVIKQLIEQEQIPVELVLAPTHRANDGLALSSRNQRLSAEARQKASLIYSNLCRVANGLKQAEPFKPLQEAAIKQLIDHGFTPEYLLLADANTLVVCNEVSDTEPMVLLIAAWLDGVRLIDNITL